MKCPICNSDNPAGVSTCQQCGFGLSLSEDWWPDAVPAGAAEPETPPEALAVEAPPVSPEAAEPRAEDWAARVDEEVAKTSRSPLDDNAQARLHIANGFEAVRQNKFDRARQEFEQALELADDPDIFNLAQTQLDALDQSTPRAFEKPTPPAKPIPKAIVEAEYWDELVEEASPPPKERVIPIAGPVLTLKRSSVMSIGLGVGLTNGVLTACGSVCFLGLIFAPIFGFAAGLLVARQAKRDGRQANLNLAFMAGGAVGLGSWLGEVIGHPIWLAGLGSNNSEAPFEAIACGACVIGTVYMALSMLFSPLGWKLASRAQPAQRSPGR